MMKLMRAHDSRWVSGGFALLLFTLVVLVPACSSKAEEDDGGDPLSCQLNTSFVGRVHANGTIILQASRTSCGEIDLDVLLTGISGVFTIGFDVTYETGILSFNGYTEGPFLKQGSPATPPFFSVNEISPGRIAVFATRFSPDGAVSAVSDSVLLTLRFRATSTGEGAVVFDLASSPVEEQILDQNASAVSVSFVNGSNLARVF